MDVTKSYAQNQDCLERGKQQADLLVAAAPSGTPVVLVTFGQYPTVLFSRPLTPVHRGELQKLLGELAPSSDLGTQVPAALQACAQAIQACGWQEKDFSVYLFSDGITEGGTASQPEAIPDFGRLTGLGLRNPDLLATGVGPEPEAMEQFITEEIANHWQAPSRWSQFLQWGRQGVQIVGFLALLIGALWGVTWLFQRRTFRVPSAPPPTPPNPWD